MDVLEIRAGGGIGKIALRAPSSTVRSYLGEPDAIDGNEWTYDRTGIAVTFDGDRVASIDGFGESVAVGGTTIGDKEIAAIADIVSEAGWGDPKIEIAGDGRTEFWRFGNGVEITFVDLQFDCATVSVPRAAVRDVAAAPRAQRDYTRRRLFFWGTFAAAFSVFALFVAKQTHDRGAKIKTWPVTNASITRITHADKKDRVDLDYTVNGERRHDVDEIVNASQYHVGDAVVIRYNPSPDMRAVYIDREVPDGSGTFAFAMLAAAMAAALYVWLAIVVVKKRT